MIISCSFFFSNVFFVSFNPSRIGVTRSKTLVIDSIAVLVEDNAYFNKDVIEARHIISLLDEFDEIWRFLMCPSLEDIVDLQLCIFYKLFFITCPPCWNFLLQNIPLRSDFCKSESLFSRKKRKDIDGKSFFNTVIPLTILSDCKGDFS